MAPGATLTDSVSDYCQSQHFVLLDAQLKQNAEALLYHWAQAAGEDPSALTVKEAMVNMAHLDLPLSQRQGFPELLLSFLEFLPSTGRFAMASSWASVVEGASQAYQASFREDGTVRGTTVRKPVTPVGRNEPCPCGSGRKFKKCCGKG